MLKRIRDVDNIPGRRSEVVLIRPHSGAEGWEPSFRGHPQCLSERFTKQSKRSARYLDLHPALWHIGEASSGGGHMIPISDHPYPTLAQRMSKPSRSRPHAATPASNEDFHDSPHWPRPFNRLPANNRIPDRTSLQMTTQQSAYQRTSHYPSEPKTESSVLDGFRRRLVFKAHVPEAYQRATLVSRKPSHKNPPTLGPAHHLE